MEEAAAFSSWWNDWLNTASRFKQNVSNAFGGCLDLLCVPHRQWVTAQGDVTESPTE